MSEHESDDSRSPEQDGPPPVRLAEVREQRGLSQTDVARELHLDVKLIAALEEKALDRLPGPIYVTGYLRNYARLLELPEEQVLASFELQSAEAPALMPENLDYQPMRGVSVVMARNLVFLLAFAALAGGGVWWWLQSDSASTPGEEPIPPPPAVSQTPQLAPVRQQEPAKDQPIDPEPITEPAPPAAAMERETVPAVAPAQATAPAAPAEEVEPAATAPAGPLVLNYLADSWTEVQGADGRRLVFRMVTEGTTLRLDGRPPFRLVFGFAPAVEVYYRGERVRTEPYTRNDVARFRVGTAAQDSDR
ncbi:MAG: helix-turn-helix domain-containing protein [Pseudomonadota bacterium]|nr:MAG: helix-turn-helix domain-containing protein [Pseudomonadota bacterium]